MRTTAASAGRLAQPDLPARQGRAVFAANAVLWDRAAQRARPVPPDLLAARLARQDPLVLQVRPVLPVPQAQPVRPAQLVLAVPQAQPARVEQQARLALPVPLVPAV